MRSIARGSHSKDSSMAFPFLSRKAAHYVPRSALSPCRASSLSLWFALHTSERQLSPCQCADGPCPRVHAAVRPNHPPFLRLTATGVRSFGAISRVLLPAQWLIGRIEFVRTTFTSQCAAASLLASRAWATVPTIKIIERVLVQELIASIQCASAIDGSRLPLFAFLH
eukprot:scaffold130654_cov31-Tisochrysis_lutea.AAC.1